MRFGLLVPGPPGCFTLHALRFRAEVGSALAVWRNAPNRRQSRVRGGSLLQLYSILCPKTLF